MTKQNISDLMSSFREIRNQMQSSVNLEAPKKERKKSTSSNYDKFMEKYNNLADNIDSFNSVDLAYYFREKSRENGYHYVIASIRRDAGIFKKLLDRYSSRDICLMIEFVYCSDQNYLDKEGLSPTVLVSSYCNTIYKDTMLWVNDKYTPKKRTTKKKAIREWDNKANSSIGDWGESDE